MELICTGCFSRPLAVHRNAEHEFVDMLVCNLGAADLPHGASVQEALRCSYCGSPVHLDHRHMAWYEA